MNSRQLSMSTMTASLLAAVALVACGRADEATAGLEAGQIASSTATSAGAPVTDSSITTVITAELARDGTLDPTRIDVDTAQGRVVLRGSAPDDEAKERAKRIALAVSGVKGVDNYLTVQSS